jgi:hypothetical protein
VGEPERINPTAGPIRHDSLSPDLLEWIGAVYGIVGPYLKTNLERFELSFMRDVHPEVEVGNWCRIAGAWQNYHQRFADEKRSAKVEGNLLAALVLISAGANDPAELAVDLEVGGRLIDCFRNAEDPTV